MKSLGITIAISLLALTFTAPAAVAQCEGLEEPIAISAGNETIYIDDRSGDANDPPGSGFIFGPQGTWIYLESNGEEGLQRGGSTGIPGGDDPCVQGTNPDTIIF